MAPVVGGQHLIARNESLEGALEVEGLIGMDHRRALKGVCPHGCSIGIVVEGLASGECSEERYQVLADLAVCQFVPVGTRD